jgi:hypothetical protein
MGMSTHSRGLRGVNLRRDILWPDALERLYDPIKHCQRTSIFFFIDMDKP